MEQESYSSLANFVNNLVFSAPPQANISTFVVFEIDSWSRGSEQNELPLQEHQILTMRIRERAVKRHIR